MKKFATYDEIENLCEALIKDFMKRKHYTNAHCVDIEAFVTEYLGIPIVYETFAEPDPGRIGFLSDGVRKIWVMRGNQKVQVLYPAGTAVIENYLQRPSEIGKKRFTIAHEGAHFVISKHIPAQTNAAFHSEFDGEMVYTQEMLREMMSIKHDKEVLSRLQTLFAKMSNGFSDLENKSLKTNAKISEKDRHKELPLQKQTA